MKSVNLKRDFHPLYLDKAYEPFFKFSMHFTWIIPAAAWRWTWHLLLSVLLTIPLKKKKMSPFCYSCETMCLGRRHGSFDNHSWENMVYLWSWGGGRKKQPQTVSCVFSCVLMFLVLLKICPLERLWYLSVPNGDQ